MNARSKPLLGYTLLMIVFAVAFANLGFWQWSRAQWKERLIAGYAAATTEAPKALNHVLGLAERLPTRADAAAAASAEGLALPLRVSGVGHFVAGSTLLLDNQVRDERVGAMVYALFQPQGATRAVLVNLGWVPLDAARQPPPLSALPDADREVDVRGMLAPLPASGLRLGNARFARGAAPTLMTYLDIDELRRDLAPDLFDGALLLDADAGPGYDRHWQLLPNTLPPERHRGYAVQWWALAVAVFVTWLILTVRARR